MRTAVILIGASGGIGQELCKNLLAEGCQVLAISRTNPGIVAAVNYKWLELDITLAGAGDAILKEVSFFEGAELRVLIHNAGYLNRNSFASMSDEELERMAAVNYRAPFQITRSLITWLQEAVIAHTIYIGSMSGYQGSRKYAGLTGYSASKAAGSALMECLAAEYAGSNMYFNVLSLGAVQTPMLEKAFPGQKGADSGQISSYIAGFSLGGWRVFNGKVLPVTQGDPL